LKLFGPSSSDVGGRAEQVNPLAGGKSSWFSNYPLFMASGKTSETLEFLAGFWLGVLALYLSYIRLVPAVVFVPDGMLSIAAGFAAGFGYPNAAEAIAGLALVLLVVGLVLLIQQGPG
jgi:hypothetical protein